MKTQEYTGTLVDVICGECSSHFGLDIHFYETRREDHKTFYCPNGHGRAYNGETPRQKAERELRYERESRQWYQDQLNASERSKAAIKGHLTRARNKIANGVCPVAGCHRNFHNVKNHIATVHPEWHLLDVETGKPAVL